MIRAGELRHRVIIEKNIPTRNSVGAEIPAWSAVATRWAAVEPLSGREFFDSQRINAELTHRVRLRHLAGVTPKMRVNFAGRLFDIVNVVNPGERNVELHLLCTEIV